MDVFKATQFVLNKLKNRIVMNGIILIDDYGSVHGANKAVRYFFEKSKNLKIKKLSYYKVPSYIINFN